MNPEQHWKFTINEWNSEEFKDYLDMAFTYPIEVIYDIGACVGGWSKVVLDNFGPREIYCFEPDTDNYKFIVKNLPNVGAFNFGIYYGKTESQAHSWGSNCGGLFVEGATPMSGEPMVLKKTFKLKTLEELEIPKPDLIKLDIEGGERNVIRNSSLIKEVPLLLVEWHYTNNEWSMEAHEFFERYLPNHKIINNDWGSNMFLLKYEN